MSFGRRLRLERVKLGLNQQQFARSVGVSQPAQANYERDARFPNIDYLARAESLGVDLSYLISEVPLRRRLAQPELMDLLEELVSLIADLSNQRVIPLSPQAQGRIVRTIFPHVVEWQEVRREQVVELAQLHAA